MCIMAVVCCTAECDADAVSRWGTGGIPQTWALPLSPKSLVKAVVKPVNSYTVGVFGGWSGLFGSFGLCCPCFEGDD